MKTSFNAHLLLILAVVVFSLYVPLRATLTTSPASEGPIAQENAGVVPVVEVWSRYQRVTLLSRKQFDKVFNYDVRYKISYAASKIRPSLDENGTQYKNPNGALLYFYLLTVTLNIGAHPDVTLHEFDSRGIYPEIPNGPAYAESWTGHVHIDVPSLARYHGPLERNGPVVSLTGPAAEEAIAEACRRGKFGGIIPTLPSITVVPPYPPELTMETIEISETSALDRLITMDDFYWDGQNFDHSEPLTAYLATPTSKSKSVQKMQYRFVLTPNSPLVINWVEVFTPKDTSQPKNFIFQSWTPQAGETESSIYTLDPLGLDSADVNATARRPIQDGMWEMQLIGGLSVDANRDGTIKLASEDASDATSPEKPYRFWINDDDDGLVDSSVNIPLFSYTEIEENDIDVAKSRAPDNENDAIDGKRDLEDLARLRIAISSLRSIVNVGESKDGEIKLGLRWKIASDTPDEERHPSIRLFLNANGLGLNTYLFDEAFADIQVQRDQPFVWRLGVIAADDSRPWVIPDSIIMGAAPDIQLIFEGITSGRGELQLVVLKRNEYIFEEIGQGPSVHLELKRANQRCHRWTCGDEDSTPPEGLRPDPRFARLPTEASSLPDEERDIVLYVHGYNMSEYLKQRWIETVYKRLWHLGYKGHVGGFTWPTAQSAIQFADSEVIAWQSGSKLNELLSDLKNHGYRVHVLAHSLGNVVAAEALHLWRGEGRIDALVGTYIASQAAIPASVYNSFAQTMPDVEKIPYTGLPRVTLPPDVYARYWKTGDSGRFPESWANDNQSYSAKVLIQSAAIRWANFYNRNDYALSGFWEIGNRLKPAKLANFATGTLDSQFDYSATFGFSQEHGTIISLVPLVFVPLSTDLLQFPENRYDIFSFAAPAWSLALGTIPTDGAFTSSTNLASTSYGFGNEHLWHSGQFRSYYAARWRYWNQVLIESQLKSPE